MNTCPALHQTGTIELPWAMRPTEDTTPRRLMVGCGPLTWLPHGATRRAQRGELGASHAAPGLQPRTLRWPWGRGAAPSLTAADGRVCNDRSLGPLVGTGDGVGALLHAVRSAVEGAQADAARHLRPRRTSDIS